MDFPQYRKMDAPAGVRGPFFTLQFFKFIGERQTLNIRLDNVTSIGYAQEMPAEVAASMLEDWQASTEAEFLQAYAKAYAVLVDWLE